MTFLLCLFLYIEYSHAEFRAQTGRLSGALIQGDYILRGCVVVPEKYALGWHGNKGIQNFSKPTPLRSWPTPWEFPNVSLVLIEVAVSILC